MIRTQYTVEVCEDNVNGGVCIALVDGYRDDWGPWGIHEPRLLAHDILEHLDGPAAIGPVTDELQALGAVAYVRPEAVDYALKYDVLNVLTDDEDWYDSTAPRVSLTDGTDTLLRKAAVAGVLMYREEYDEDVPVLSTARAVYRWMAYGYARTAVHYARVNPGWMFTEITAAAKLLLENWTEECYVGCTFDLTLDFADGTVILSPEPTNWHDDY
jgi:hypothetical protein